MRRKLPSDRVSVDFGEAFLFFWNGGSILFVKKPADVKAKIISNWYMFNEHTRPREG